MLWLNPAASPLTLPRFGIGCAERLHGPPPQVVFEVEDNGRGIAAENLDRIFRHGFTTRAGGHGFGLHSAANAAGTMGGKLTVRSAGPGAGATFTLTLPLAAEGPAGGTA